MCNDAKLANYWLHYEHLVDNGKMSKSLECLSVDNIVARV